MPVMPIEPVTTVKKEKNLIYFIWLQLANRLNKLSWVLVSLFGEWRQWSIVAFLESWVAFCYDLPLEVASKPHLPAQWSGISHLFER
jgi:hypothetical protein